MTNSVLFAFNRRLLLLTIATLSLLISIYLYTSSTNPFLFQSFTHVGLHSVAAPPPELRRTRVAVCLVGGARRFELTGPSIVENILEAIPDSDLFLHSPLDDKSFKFSLLRTAPRIASVRIFEPQHINETESAVRVLHARSSPRGVQGLLQYFSLVEGCLSLIQKHQKIHKFKYEWIVRTRVDGYWSAPLDPATFVSGEYSVPVGSCYGGLNDRLGIGDLNTSTAALSRLSLLPAMDSSGFSHLNSEAAFQAQLSIRNVSFSAKSFPFCVVTDRQFSFPPANTGLPIAATSSAGALSGAYCRPCTPFYRGDAAVRMAQALNTRWGWIEPGNGTSLHICHAGRGWEPRWGEIFDRAAGAKLAAARKRVDHLTLEDCVTDFEDMKRRSTGTWEVPPSDKVCAMGLIKHKYNLSSFGG